MKKTFVLLILVQLFFVSCDEIQLKEKTVDCYFQYEYVNYAWGFNHSGFTITPSGEVFSFNKSTAWVFADNNKLSSANLKKNIEASLKLDTLIKKSDLDYYQQLAFDAFSGKLSEPVQRGADMGEIICKIIVPDTVDPLGDYSEVMLTEKGDFDRNNLSPEAATIAEWLTNLLID
jgi:hypothetical protein